MIDPEKNKTEWKKLERRIEEIESIIAPYQKEIAEIDKCILVLKSRFEIGDVIEWRGSRRGRVIGIQPWVCDKVEWWVPGIRKDGSRGEVCVVREYYHPKLFRGAEPKEKK